MGIRLLSGNSPDMLREVWDVSLLLLAALSHVCVCVTVQKMVQQKDTSKSLDMSKPKMKMSHRSCMNSKSFDTATYFFQI